MSRSGERRAASTANIDKGDRPPARATRALLALVGTLSRKHTALSSFEFEFLICVVVVCVFLVFLVVDGEQKRTAVLSTSYR